MKRRRRTAFLLALACTLFAPLTVAAGGLRKDRPNLVGGEVVGRGIGLTLIYERFLTNRFGLGVGVGAFPASTDDGIYGAMPLYASFLTGDRHSLYLSAGGALLSSETEIQHAEGAWFFTGSVGYHFQSRGGFFLRPLCSVSTGASGGGVFVLPGVTIGGSF